MKVDTFQCDICGAQKKDANHWWKVYPLADGLGVTITTWDAKSDNVDLSQKEVAHLCGENHVFEYVSKRLTKVG